MKLSTRSRYGTRLMLDLAKRYHQGPIQIGEIAKRQDVSVKYLEQLIIPLKKAKFIRSIRGPKGGHMLAKSPDGISVGDIVRVLEGGINLSECVSNPDLCERSNNCATRKVWAEASNAMVEKLNSVTLSAMADME